MGLMSTSSLRSRGRGRPPRRPPARLGRRGPVGHQHRTAAARPRWRRRRGRPRAPSRCRPRGPARPARSRPGAAAPRMNSAMMRRAASVSMASSAGSSKAGAVPDRRRPCPSPSRGSSAIDVAIDRAQARADRAPRRSGASAPALAHDPVELAQHHLRALVAQQRRRRCARGAARRGRCRRGTGPRRGAAPGRRVAPDGADDLRAAPEADRLVDADPVDEDHEARRQLRVRRG